MKLKHNNYHNIHNIKDRHIKMCMSVFAYIYVCKKHGTSKKKVGEEGGREREEHGALIRG